MLDGCMFTHSEGDNQGMQLRSWYPHNWTHRAQLRTCHDHIEIGDDVVRLSSADQHLERTNLRNVRISTNWELLKRTHQHARHFHSFSWVWKHYQRPGTRLPVQYGRKDPRTWRKAALLLKEIREWIAESIPWVGSVEAPTSQTSYGTFEWGSLCLG